ncbi:MAG: hypothetical protein ACRYG8_24365 [Janthinobacterium lividum]
MLLPHAATDDGVEPGRFILAPEPEHVSVRRLLYDGRGVADLEGVDVAGHFQVDGVGWLVITDFDCPFEEAVRVYLLDEGFRVLETLRFGRPYVPGMVQDVRRTGPRSVAFTFPGPELVHEVEVQPRQTGWSWNKTRWLLLTSRRQVDTAGAAETPAAIA